MCLLGRRREAVSSNSSVPPIPPYLLHLLHSAHHIDWLYNDPWQLEWLGLQYNSNCILVSPQMSQRSWSCTHHSCNSQNSNSVTMWSLSNQALNHNTCQYLVFPQWILSSCSTIAMWWWWLGWSNLANLVKVAPAVKVQAGHRLRCTKPPFITPLAAKYFF